eukprot:SAG31_NODE_35568_length_321_cov_19.891892_1_plen_34_part_01
MTGGMKWPRNTVVRLCLSQHNHGHGSGGHERNDE